MQEFRRFFSKKVQIFAKCTKNETTGSRMKQKKVESRKSKAYYECGYHGINDKVCEKVSQRMRQKGQSQRMGKRDRVNGCGKRDRFNGWQ